MSGLSQADKDRIDGRVFAEVVLRDVRSMSDDFLVGFWREMRRQVKVKERGSSKTKMSDQKSREFGRRMVEFGPLDYLEWLADQGAELQLYLESRRVKAERK